MDKDHKNEALQREVVVTDNKHTVQTEYKWQIKRKRKSIGH